MKQYEQAARTALPRRLPVIIRVDGRAFHTYTKGMDTFDVRFGNAMITIAAELLREIQGAMLAYVQSDEISVLVHGYKRLASETWFGNQIQKMVSVSAGIASATMTRQFPAHVRGAVFDSRVFCLPEAEVCNYFIWRQKDAIRNSVQSLAQSLYSARELNGVKTAELLELCRAKKREWGELQPRWQYGTCVRPAGVLEYPLFNCDRAYVNDLLNVEVE